MFAELKESNMRSIKKKKKKEEKIDSAREKIFCFADALFTSYIQVKFISSWNICFFFFSYSINKRES